MPCKIIDLPIEHTMECPPPDQDKHPYCPLVLAHRADLPNSTTWSPQPDNTEATAFSANTWALYLPNVFQAAPPGKYQRLCNPSFPSSEASSEANN